MHLHTRAGLQAGLLTLALAACAWGQGAPAKTSQPQTIPLRYARPWEIVRLMHWAEGADKLPPGVRAIEALPDSNALRVEGTPEGVAQVRDIAQNLDIKPRPVRIRLQFIRAARHVVDGCGIPFDLVPLPNPGEEGPMGFRQVASGSRVTKLLDTLAHGQPDAGATSVLVTTNNVPATASTQALFRTPEPDAPGDGRFPILADTRVTVSPRINSDGTITLGLSPSVSVIGPGNATALVTLQTLRTVHSGETMVLGVFTCDAQTEMLLFATPTLLPN